MSEDLQTLLGQIRSDLGDDFISTDIVGLDGMSIAGENSDETFNVQLAAAHFAMVMKLADKVSSNLKLGKVNENLLTTAELIAMSRFLGDGSFYWLLITRGQATLGFLRAVMDEYELRIWGAIPS